MSFISSNRTPQMDDNGNDIANEKIDGFLSRGYTLGAGIMLAGDDPLIGEVSPEQTIVDETSAIIWAEDVTTTGTIEKVWAVIIQYRRDRITAELPVVDLPKIELTLNVSTERYEGLHDGFAVNGEYDVTVYARDTDGNISMPKSTRVIKGILLRGDIDGDGSVDLTDAIVALKTLVGLDTTEDIRSGYMFSSFEANDDGRIGMAELFYAVQSVAGLR